MTKDHNARNRASRERLAAVVARMGERSVVIPGGWTAAALLAHLAFWDRFVAVRVEKYVGDRKPMAHGNEEITEAINSAGLEQWIATPPAVAAHLATTAAAAVDQLVEGLPDDVFDEIRAMNRPRLIDRSLHRKEHLDEIERALR